jgi:hypothetical protein
MPPTSLLIRVQALGGKFLGPDIGYAYVTVRDVLTGGILAQGVAAGDSGVLPSTPPPAPQQQPPAGVPNGAIFLNGLAYWLGIDDTTAGFTATMELDAPALAEISASTIVNGLPSDEHVVRTRMWLIPGQDLTANPGLVLVIPGLNVEILTPSPVVSGELQAWVTMMCGCKVGAAYWPASDFTVTLTIINLADGSATTQLLTLSDTPSLYMTTLNLASGNYQLVVTAVQTSTSNCGSASAYISVS